MTKKILIMVLAVGLAAAAQAQKGSVRLTGDVKVEELVKKHIELNERTNSIPGYRVQIASMAGPNSRQKAFGMKESFYALYPEVAVYVVFDEPNFKVKVGDFRTRLEAFAFLQRIKETFPGYIISDNINLEQLNWDNFVPETDEDAEE